MKTLSDKIEEVINKWFGGDRMFSTKIQRFKNDISDVHKEFIQKLKEELLKYPVSLDQYFKRIDKLAGDALIHSQDASTRKNEGRISKRNCSISIHPDNSSLKKSGEHPADCIPAEDTPEESMQGKTSRFSSSSGTSQSIHSPNGKLSERDSHSIEDTEPEEIGAHPKASGSTQSCAKCGHEHWIAGLVKGYKPGDKMSCSKDGCPCEKFIPMEDAPFVNPDGDLDGLDFEKEQKGCGKVLDIENDIVCGDEFEKGYLQLCPACSTANAVRHAKSNKEIGKLAGKTKYEKANKKNA